MKELIRKLVEAWGPSGYEHRVRALIREEVEAYADEITEDALGNLICRVGQGGTKVMIAAHMDEIGIMTTFVEKNTGYLRFINLGGLIQNTLMGNRVQFEDGTIGVVVAPEYNSANRTTVPSEFDSYYVDVSDGESVLPASIGPGSPATFWRNMEERGTRLISKAMDDRIGCVVAIETMKRLNKQTSNELYFVFTVQEEVGLRGARPAAFNVNPDLAIALDVTGTGDYPDNGRMGVKLGGGTAIKVHDPGHIVPLAIRNWMIAHAEEENIPHQLELLKGGTTDSSGIQISRSGIPSGTISIPCRYVHTTSETVDIRDVEASINLLFSLTSKPATL